MRGIKMKRCKWQMGVALVPAVLWLFTGLGCIGPEKKPSPEIITSPEAMKAQPPTPGIEPAPKVELEPTAENFIHDVKWPGESLSIIAGWYTGDIQNWKALAPLNPHIKPDLIRVGDRIVIPRNMMKTEENMPKEYVEKFVPQEGSPAEPSPSKEGQTTDEEEPKLFGPRLRPKK